MAMLVIYPGVIEALEHNEAVLAALERRAEAGRQLALRIAPVRTGYYASHFFIVRANRGGKTVVRLVNTTYYAIYLEYGTRYMRRQRVLGRAMDGMR